MQGSPRESRTLGRTPLRHDRGAASAAGAPGGLAGAVYQQPSHEARSHCLELYAAGALVTPALVCRPS
jgi:hypothetical protein